MSRLSADPKDSRLVARASLEVHEHIRHAAELSGSTISQFLIEAAVARADVVIEKSRTTRLGVDAANTIFEMLENPPAAPAKLVQAARQYRKKKGFYLAENRKA